ncbi:spore germination lipoprotein GerD [Bacillus fonticola]|uniref:spore germination lipoprotein GerD n=1 Tax=Bacillus fonticola TaxID=2728853 RepID=UPI0014764890|nr:spore germination lipoprotein GerD [Bacillus fonticola]
MKQLIILLCVCLIATGCGGKGQAQGGQLEYEETKKMMVDILKSDDGKKAIEEILTDEKMKQQLVMDQKVVTETITSTLSSEQGAEFWKKSFEDPAFAETMAKSMMKENEKILKKLMKDPEYQGMMLELLKDPEFEKQLSEQLKGQEFRSHLQTVILETLESPLFQKQVQEQVKKAGESGSSSAGGEEGESGGESGSSEGGSGGQEKSGSGGA